MRTFFTFHASSSMARAPDLQRSPGLARTATGARASRPPHAYFVLLTASANVCSFLKANLLRLPRLDSTMRVPDSARGAPVRPPSMTAHPMAPTSGAPTPAERRIFAFFAPASRSPPERSWSSSLVFGRFGVGSGKPHHCAEDDDASHDGQPRADTETCRNGTERDGRPRRQQRVG